MEVGNIYPKLYTKGFYDGMKAEGDENPINLVRSAWAGSAKYGALVWSGDIDSTLSLIHISAHHASEPWRPYRRHRIS